MTARTEGTERDKALTEAWQAVDRAVTPLGYGGGATNSPWNQGYEKAKNEALNAILALRDGSLPSGPTLPDPATGEPYEVSRDDLDT